MLIIFSVNDQKITHDLKGQLVAGSVDIVQAAFKFDSSWDELDKIVVFTSSACPKPVPVQFADEAFYIPKDVLKPGKLYVSVVGFGLDGRKKTTQKWDIMQAITVQNCGDGGDCDLLRYLAQGQVADGKVAKDEEVKDMLDTVFGKSEAPKPDPGGSDSNDKNVSEDDIATAIAKSAHARFEKVEKVPSNDEAQDNVLYLVMNAATGYYDIYAKVGEKVVRLDDTTVDLSNYATIEQLNAVSGGIGGTVYAGAKEDLSASDDSVIAAYFKAHTDVAVKKGDVFVVTTTVGNSTYEKSAYFYDGKAWVAMTGNVDADKVILRENITLAGGYTQVGNLTKSQNGTATFSTKGKSVMDALTEIFSKRLQPSITAQPSIGTFTLTGAGAVEAGTKVAAAAYSGATLNAGSYQYGPATGVTATNWKVERITNAATTQVTTADAASLTAGSDNNSGSGFIIGDAGGDNAVSSLKYRVTATHGAGVTAKDNLGADSSPVVAIAAGSKTKDTAAYTPFRNVFYGASASKAALDSAAIRALGKTGKAYAAGTLTINVPVGAQRVAIACIATAKGVTKVINETAMNADVTSTFTKSTVSVEGANGYAAKDYNVWVFEPAVAYGNAAVLKVTLG